MDANQNKRHRRSIRLQGFDYSQTGAYFVTICTRERTCIFGEVIDAEMRLNNAGEVVDQCWLAIPKHFPDVDLDAYVVMPNHVHGILVITDGPVGAKDFSPLHNNKTTTRRLKGTLSGTIGSIVRGFKIGVTKRLRDATHNDTVWQRSYYEHIIRHEESLNRIRQYILHNPARWSSDRENPEATNVEPKEAWLG
jgi:putative transposase